MTHNRHTPTRLQARSHGRWPDRLTSIGLVAALSLTAACAPQDYQPDGTATVAKASTGKFQGTLVDPALTPAPVTLRDTDGKPVRIDEPRPGTATAVFFGFTNCHDVCPTTMADLAAARRSLPAATAVNVDLLFITVDPQRDTPAVLRRWLDQFDPNIVGLRGPVQRVHAVEDSLYSSQSSKSTATPEATHTHEHQSEEDGHTHPYGDPDGYGVDHSSVVYLLGPDGTTLIYTGGATPLDYAADLTRLLNG